jgi:vitamin B12 transporter
VDANSFSVNVSKVKTDGISAINSNVVMTNPDKDGYDNTTFDAQVKHVFNANHQLSASLFSTHGESQYDTAYDALYNPTATTDRNSTRAALEKLSLASNDQLNELWHSKLNWARGIDDSRDYLNDVEDSRLKTVNDQLAWQNEFQLADAQHVNLAAEHLVQSVYSDTQYNQTRRDVNSLLGGYLGEYGAQQVQFNLRQDRYSDFGTANTGLLGYGWSFADKWRATASISNAFKAPTFNDLYYPGYSNPDLRPERSQNREIGLRYAIVGQSFKTTYFDNRIRDLIASDSTFTTVINVNQAHIYGQELSYSGELGNISLDANATWQNPRDTVTGQLLLRRAKQFANISVKQHIGAWEAGGELQYSGARQDVNISTSAPVTLPGYSVLDLNVRYQMDKTVIIKARIENLFNREYMLVDGYNTLGRTLFVGLSYQQ